MATQRRTSRPRSDTGFFEGWEFKSWGEAVATLVVMVTACALCLVLLGWVLISSEKAAYEYTETTTYWVEEGDTLWRIAREYCTERQDVRRVIDIIEEVNDCTATIYPGQCLTVPVFYK